jgi:hypothetical protein
MRTTSSGRGIAMAREALATCFSYSVTVNIWLEIP